MFFLLLFKIFIFEDYFQKVSLILKVSNGSKSISCIDICECFDPEKSGIEKQNDLLLLAGSAVLTWLMNAAPFI